MLQGLENPGRKLASLLYTSPGCVKHAITHVLHKAPMYLAKQAIVQLLQKTVSTLESPHKVHLLQKKKRFTVLTRFSETGYRPLTAKKVSALESPHETHEAKTNSCTLTVSAQQLHTNRLHSFPTRITKWIYYLLQKTVSALESSHEVHLLQKKNV